jgi:hypothetical protein
MLSTAHQRRIANVVILLSLTVTAGCYREFVSQAELAPNNQWHSEKASSGVFLVGPEIKIAVRTSNRLSRFNDYREGTYLGISLYFSTERPDFRFNPTDVSVYLPGSGKVEPSRVRLVLAGLGNSPNWMCGNYPFVDFGRGPLYNIRRGFCAELYFDIAPPSPKTEFKMKIHGLFSGDERVAIPDIYFREGKVWVLEFLLGH